MMNTTIRGVSPPSRNFVTPSAVKSLGSARPCKGVGLKGAGNKCIPFGLPFAALLALLLSTPLAQTLADETAARIAGDTRINTRITALGSAGVSAEVTAREEADTALNNRVDELEEDLSAGIAMSMTMQTPTISPGKDLNLSIGAGFYNGQKAVAVSFGARIDENACLSMAAYRFRCTSRQ